MMERSFLRFSEREISINKDNHLVGEKNHGESK